MGKLQIFGFLCMIAFITLGTSFANPRVKTYVNDFVFPTEDGHVTPPWQQFTNGHSSQSRDLKLCKCSDFRGEDSSGNARQLQESRGSSAEPKPSGTRG